MFRANALTLYLAFPAFAVGGRIALHYLATGDHGIRTAKRTASDSTAACSFLHRPVWLPHIHMLIFLATAWLSIELHLRFVEEPHLRNLHGADGRKYADQAGRYFRGFVITPGDSSCSCS